MNCTWDWRHPDNMDAVTPEKAHQILGFYGQPETPAAVAPVSGKQASV